ncbi:chromosome segregation protein SMC [Caenispirillum bisanense]|uniref:Chromosome partition protein Smc n=1 Tax=Caenispirillum bisanense TaxID=414052 RepID=A0A286GVX8_9PROT|nr:chromosome segregation protein SMC [Caenispirillum bisanense]SOD99683.1 condensin subunit Smc [Caenispirillum bisanense]
MIRFSRLRLSGFKSFVDPTDLLIEPGMTGVVGPNGCGKSNLVEALRWVMGETSAKQMRGGEMDDVIFGGTATRPSRNIAEVTVSLDNRDRSAPALFNTVDELEITRRIERGKGSVYRVNGKETRAKDVMLLFADAATGARSTAMVSQGRVGALINAKPSQRRSLLEEAAGIGGLHTRRHEAELRLKGAEANLQRLEDVLQALGAQLGNLRKQARQAARYRALSEQIRQVEALVLHLRWTKAITALEKAKEQFRLAEGRVAELTGLAASASRAHLEADEAMPALRQAEAEAAARLQRLVLAREQLDAEERRIASARQDAEVRLRQIADDIDRERLRAQDADEAVARLEEERDALIEASSDEELEQEEARERLQRVNDDVTEREAELTRLTERAAAEDAQRKALLRRAEEADLRAERAERRLRETEDSRASAAAAGVPREDLDVAEERLYAAEEALETARAARAAAEEARDARQGDYEAARDALQTESAARARLKAEIDALTDLLAGDRDETTGEATAPVLDALAVRPGSEQALGAALGDDLAAPVAETGARRWQALPPVAGAAGLPAGVEPLDRMVSGAPALARRLAATGLVKDRDTAAALARELAPGQRLVTPEGDLWRWDGFVAEAGAPSAAATRLKQRNRLAELRESLVELDERVEVAETRVEDARLAVEHAQEAARTARDRERAAEQSLTDARNRQIELSRRNAATESRLSALDQTLEQLAADLAEARAQVEEAREQRARLGDGGGDRQRVDTLRAEVAELRTRLAEARSLHDRVFREAEERARRVKAVEAELESWHRRKDGTAGQFEELEARREAVMEDLAHLAERPVEIAEQRETLAEEIERAEVQRRIAADRLAEGDSRLRDADRTLREAEQALAKAREERVRGEGAVETGRQQCQQIAAAIAERLDCTPEQTRALAGLDDPEAPAAPDLGEAEDRLQRLSREREMMGPVNLRAEQEAQELEEQVATLTAERDDLTGAIARLRQGIAELNREGRQRLLASFEKVDRNFRTLFVRLFGGGRAHLALTESDDPLEAGLEIMASPPGKRLQILSLLSGGEQAMTALALLFAVFLVNPAPICVLDEVDAPLDDANVDRFCAMLDELTRMSEASTRFLVVTHHRMTMARMDRLFGVTMAERGVSTLVSVDLHEAERLREAG